MPASSWANTQDHTVVILNKTGGKNGAASNGPKELTKRVHHTVSTSTGRAPSTIERMEETQNLPRIDGKTRQDIISKRTAAKLTQKDLAHLTLNQVSVIQDMEKGTALENKAKQSQVIRALDKYLASMQAKQ